jgi:hypothetical protein
VTEGFEEVSRSLSENPADLQRTVGRLILTRWVAGLMVIAGTFLASVRFGLDLPATQLYLVGASILAYNGLLSLMWRRDRDGNPAVPVPRSQRLLILQILLDWLALLVFIHLTGGATSPAIPVLGIHMLMVTILLPSPAQYVYLAMGLAGLALVAVLEYQGALAHYSLLPAIPADIYQDPLYVAAQIGFFAIAASATVALAPSGAAGDGAAGNRSGSIGYPQPGRGSQPAGAQRRACPAGSQRLDPLAGGGWREPADGRLLWPQSRLPGQGAG